MTSSPRKKPSATRAKGNASPETKSWRRRLSKAQGTMSSKTLRDLGGVFQLVIDQAEILGAEIPEAFPTRSLSRGVAVDMVFEKSFTGGLNWRQTHRVFIPYTAIKKVQS